MLPDAVGTNAGTGLIEEGGKGLILLAVATLVRPRVPRDGMVLGATVGAGFAAFESAGYALRALIDHSRRPSGAERGPDRGVPCRPRAVRPHHVDRHPRRRDVRLRWATGHFRLDRRVLWTFLGVVACMRCWDASYGWAIRISAGSAAKAGLRLARHLRVGRDADRCGPAPLPGGLRRHARRRRRDRLSCGRSAAGGPTRSIAGVRRTRAVGDLVPLSSGEPGTRAEASSERASSSSVSTWTSGARVHGRKPVR